MRKLTTYLLLVTFLASCSMSNDVVNNGLFQKRKYNKGSYSSLKKDVRDTKSANSEGFGVGFPVVQDRNNNAIKVSDEPIKDESTLDNILSYTEIDLTLDSNRIRNKFKNKSSKGKFSNNVIFLDNGNVSRGTSKRNNASRIFIKPGVNGDDNARLVIGLIIMVLISPLGVGIALGFGSASVKTNFLLYLASILFLSIGLSFLFSGPIIVSYVMLIIGGLFVGAMWGQGAVAIIREF